MSFEPNSSYEFDFAAKTRSIIKVIGVGGAGCNAVNYMQQQSISDIDFVVCNTDIQVLNLSPVKSRLQIGAKLTEGLGAGNNPQKGRAAAEESIDEIRDILMDNTKMLFITAGMGGGTGTGAAPVIASVARELGLLTVAIVTYPTMFEGPTRINSAIKGIEALKETCDTVIVIMNDKVMEMAGDLGVSKMYEQADGVLTTAARSIAEIITSAGYQNIDFEDVRTVMSNAGTAVLGSAQVSGDDRALRAVKDALASPLLDNRDIEGAEHLLVSISTSRESELTISELQGILAYLYQSSGKSANLIWGQSYDATLGENVRVTVIATGFDKLPSQIRTPVGQDYERGPFLALDSAEKTIPIALDPSPSKIYSGGSPNPYAELRTPPPSPDSRPEMPAWPSASTPQRTEPTFVPTAVPVAALPPSFATEAPLHNLPPAETTPLIIDGRQLPLPPSGSHLPPHQPTFIPPVGTEVPRPGFMSGIGASSRPAFAPSGPSEDQISLEEKKKMFAERLAKRKEALSNNGQQARPTLDFNKLDEPAYKRHNIDVRDQVAPHSPIISRVTLTEDNELNKNNRYLDDNVC